MSICLQPIWVYPLYTLLLQQQLQGIYSTLCPYLSCLIVSLLCPSLSSHLFGSHSYCLAGTIKLRLPPKLKSWYRLLVDLKSQPQAAGSLSRLPVSVPPVQEPLKRTSRPTQCFPSIHCATVGPHLQRSHQSRATPTKCKPASLYAFYIASTQFDI